MAFLIAITTFTKLTTPNHKPSTTVFYIAFRGFIANKILFALVKYKMMQSNFQYIVIITPPTGRIFSEISDKYD